MPNSPVNVIVNSSKAPARISAFTDSFTVVNSSATSTVWIGDDPSVRTGTGIKLAPLASARRMAGVETFAILDTASTDPAPLLLSFSIDQYQDPYSVALALQNSGLILVDNPVAVVPATNFTTTNTFTLPAVGQLYDVRTLQSIYLYYISSGGHAITINIFWYANVTMLPSDNVGIDTFVWVAADPWPVVGRQLPVRGSYMQVTVAITGGVPNDTLAIQGSHRLWSPLAVRLTNRVLIDATGAIGANATVTVDLNARWDGPAYFYCEIDAPAGEYVACDFVDKLTGRAFATGVQQGATYVFFNRAFVQGQIVCPRNSWGVNVSHAGANVRTYRLYVTAAPEGT